MRLAVCIHKYASVRLRLNKEVIEVMSGSKIESSGSVESWLSSEGKKLDEKSLLELWKQYHINEVAYLDLHFKYTNWYSAFFIALLAAYVVGLSEYYKSLVSMLFLALPLSVMVLAQLGKRAVDRFYQRFLETVAMLAKVERLLGLDGAIWKESSTKTMALWPEDKHFILSRYFQSRYDSRIKSSEEFIRESMKLGANKIVHHTFSAFQIIALILLFGGIALFTLVRLCVPLA